MDDYRENNHGGFGINWGIINEAFPYSEDI
jgi:hypothetical protein